jgi:hypothetical protein
MDLAWVRREAVLAAVWTASRPLTANRPFLDEAHKVGTMRARVPVVVVIALKQRTAILRFLDEAHKVGTTGARVPVVVVMVVA